MRPKLAAHWQPSQKNVTDAPDLIKAQGAAPRPLNRHALLIARKDQKAHALSERHLETARFLYF